jgi:hypothetical protein
MRAEACKNVLCFVRKKYNYFRRNMYIEVVGFSENENAWTDAFREILDQK